MNIRNQALKAKEKIGSSIESRLERVENFIAKRGIGSSQLNKAKKAQRNANLAIAAGSVVAIVGIAGITAWAMTGSDDDRES